MREILRRLVRLCKAVLERAKDVPRRVKAFLLFVLSVAIWLFASPPLREIGDKAIEGLVAGAVLGLIVWILSP